MRSNTVRDANLGIIHNLHFLQLNQRNAAPRRDSVTLGVWVKMLKKTYDCRGENT